MRLRAVARIKIMNNGFAVEYPTPAYAAYFRDKVAQAIKLSGGVMEVVIQDPTETDSQAFMRLFHAVRDSFAKHWNEARDKVEADLVGHFGVKEGLKKRLKRDYGSITDDGEPKSLTKYSRGDWISLLRGTITEALELGIDIMDQAIEYETRQK
jgi:hypothetical protein